MRSIQWKDRLWNLKASLQISNVYDNLMPAILTGNAGIFLDFRPHFETACNFGMATPLATITVPTASTALQLSQNNNKK